MKELMFIPTEDLIDELKSRCTVFITAYVAKDDKGEKIESRWSEASSWIELIGLANILRTNIEQEFREGE